MIDGASVRESSSKSYCYHAPEPDFSGDPAIDVDLNDFLPYLTLDMRRFKTMSIAIQYLKGGYGSSGHGRHDGLPGERRLCRSSPLPVLPEVHHQGVMAGAVKGGAHRMGVLSEFTINAFSSYPQNTRQWCKHLC